MEPSGFQVRKAAQVVAFLVLQQGNEANVMKTVKLAYMADRRFLELYDMPILYDDLSSMEHGPVVSTTYDYIKGKGTAQGRKIWNHYVRDRAENTLRAAKAFTESDLDELSNAE